MLAIFFGPVDSSKSGPHLCDCFHHVNGVSTVMEGAWSFLQDHNRLDPRCPGGSGPSHKKSKMRV
jgi:hypothetical protein